MSYVLIHVAWHSLRCRAWFEAEQVKLQYSADYSMNPAYLEDSTAAKFERMHVSRTPKHPRTSFLSRKVFRDRLTWMDI
jgi:hypothetical protein